MLTYNFSRRVVLFGALVSTIVILWPHLSWGLLFQPKEKTYSIRILSYGPLITYVVGFLSWVERAYLLRLGQVGTYHHQVSLTNKLFTGSRYLRDRQCITMAFKR